MDEKAAQHQRHPDQQISHTKHLDESTALMLLFLASLLEGSAGIVGVASTGWAKVTLPGDVREMGGC